MAARTILFLQGPPSPFWRELAGAFEAAGHRSVRVLLCPGDRLYWRGPAVSYRGSLAGWRDALAALVAREGVTDILYFNDQTPYHRVAAALAAEQGLHAVTVEFGYLRPGWLTLERSGMGARSHLPDDPSVIRALARGLNDPHPTDRFAHDKATEAFHETVVAFANVLLRPAFPRYDMDRALNPILEYASTLLRWARLAGRQREQTVALKRALSGAWPFMLLPLQLQTDYQIRRNSPYQDQRDMLKAACASFARCAPAALNLLVKVHPLDVGLIDWPAEVRRIAARHGLADRVVTIDGGDLAALLDRSSGSVLINSTVGLHAIRAQRPVKVLGVAVFDMAGLTHQGPLDAFWTNPEPVDPDLARDFVRVLARTIQVAGSVYEPAGRQAAVSEIVRRVLQREVNEPGAFVDPPPRLARATALGIVP